MTNDQSKYVVKVGEAWYDVYIGRNPKYGDTKWGNPFCIGVHGNREQAIEKYREWIVTQDDLMKELPKLSGKILGCHCYPQHDCHGFVILDLLKQMNINHNKQN